VNRQEKLELAGAAALGALRGIGANTRMSAVFGAELDLGGAVALGVTFNRQQQDRLAGIPCQFAGRRRRGDR
jgi:trans-2-enoyl-CoA reductase